MYAGRPWQYLPVESEADSPGLVWLQQVDGVGTGQVMAVVKGVIVGANDPSPQVAQVWSVTWHFTTLCNTMEQAMLDIVTVCMRNHNVHIYAVKTS